MHDITADVPPPKKRAWCGRPAKKPEDKAAVQKALKALEGRTIDETSFLQLDVNVRRGLSYAFYSFRNQFPEHPLAVDFGNAVGDYARRVIMCRFLTSAKEGNLSCTQTIIVENSKAKLICKDLPDRLSQYPSCVWRAPLRISDKTALENQQEVSTEAFAGIGTDTLAL